MLTAVSGKHRGGTVLLAEMQRDSPGCVSQLQSSQLMAAAPSTPPTIFIRTLPAEELNPLNSCYPGRPISEAQPMRNMSATMTRLFTTARRWAANPD